ncbi:MAG: ferredoxin [Clostridia bacterium]|nr:ferredoxin [Clostridia bacterium]
MKPHVNKDGCISCGICITIAPEIFQFDSDGVAEPITDSIPSAELPIAEKARDSCPVNVIDIK